MDISVLVDWFAAVVVEGRVTSWIGVLLGAGDVSVVTTASVGVADEPAVDVVVGSRRSVLVSVVYISDVVSIVGVAVSPVMPVVHVVEVPAVVVVDVSPCPQCGGNLHCDLRVSTLVMSGWSTPSATCISKLHSPDNKSK